MDDLRVETDGSARGARLLANRTFIKGSLVYRFKDAPLSPIQTYQTVQVGVAEHILVDDTLAKLNHACAPNVALDTRRRMAFALREVEPGEQLTYFYPSTEWDMAEPFECLCGSDQCWGWIAGAKHMPVSILERYFINPHICTLIQRALSVNRSRGRARWDPELVPQRLSAPTLLTAPPSSQFKTRVRRSG